MSIQSRTDLYKNSGINWSTEIKITKIVITSIKGSGKSPVGSKCVNMASDGFRHVRRHALLYTQVLDPLLHLKMFTKKIKAKKTDRRRILKQIKINLVHKPVKFFLS